MLLFISCFYLNFGFFHFNKLSFNVFKIIFFCKFDCHNYTGLQDKCPSVFSHLASASCVFEFEEVNNNNNSSASNNTPQGNKANNHKNPSATLKLKKSIASSFNTLTSSFQSTTSSNTIFPTTFSLSSPKLPKIHAAHALSMEALLNLGLELSSHSPDCWKYVFK